MTTIISCSAARPSASARNVQVSANWSIGANLRYYNLGPTDE